MNIEKIAENINILANFCGKRDIPFLTQEAVFRKYGIKQADIMVLFGGSIICGGDILAEGMKNSIAKRYIIVGGIGHTTDSLKTAVNKKYPEILTKDKSEAEVFQLYLEKKYNFKVDFLECRSTNCGNNITFLLDLITKEDIPCESIILVQDATIQHRMEAVLRKYRNDIKIINYAAYSITVIDKGERLIFENNISGMWEMEKYISLLMGEIPRLRDDENGYGPLGYNYIDHVDIPYEVEKAFSELKTEYKKLIREANPIFASEK